MPPYCEYFRTPDGNLEGMLVDQLHTSYQLILIHCLGVAASPVVKLYHITVVVNSYV